MLGWVYAPFLTVREIIFFINGMVYNTIHNRSISSHNLTATMANKIKKILAQIHMIVYTEIQIAYWAKPSICLNSDLVFFFLNIYMYIYSHISYTDTLSTMEITSYIYSNK